jgi:hypothetical protein
MSGEGNPGNSVSNNDEVACGHKGELKAKVTQKIGLLVEVPIVIQMGNLGIWSYLDLRVQIQKVNQTSFFGEISFKPEENR